MYKNTQEKSLVDVKNKSIFDKIKSFFKNIFSGNPNMEEQVIEKIDSHKNEFLDRIKDIENDETGLLKLQRMYRSGKIKEEDLTKEQVESLCNLYDNQISRLRKSNEIRKQRLKEYRRKIQTNN
ncbi:MAG: hypothetical protein J6I85_06425 [Clostridia bacterium]|nr:hypothetical protein [Clostridia bacterium]